MAQDARELTAVLNGQRRLLIVIHDNPDPDALASARALAALALAQRGMRARICCEGIVGRAENRALMRELRMTLTPATRVDWNAWPLVALVDTQPGAGNNSYPRRRVPAIVLDHHPVRPASRRARFVDVRPGYGSTSTILAQYLFQTETPISPALAAALCYAISSDTQDLARDADPADTETYVRLYPLADKRMLGRVLHPRLLHSYYAVLARAVLSAFTYGNLIGVHLGDIPSPDSVGLVADLLARHERMGWCIVTGVWQADLYISLRAASGRAHAGQMLRRVLRTLGQAGGHDRSAGGRVPLKDLAAEAREALQKEIVLRLVRVLRRRSDVVLRPLITPTEISEAFYIL